MSQNGCKCAASALRVLLVFITTYWLVAGVASAQGRAEELSRDQIQALIAIEHQLRTLDDLHKRGVLPAATVVQQKDYDLCALVIRQYPGYFLLGFSTG